jgi:hypothetical protein
MIFSLSKYAGITRQKRINVFKLKTNDNLPQSSLQRSVFRFLSQLQVVFLDLTIPESGTTFCRSQYNFHKASSIVAPEPK